MKVNKYKNLALFISYRLRPTLKAWAVKKNSIRNCTRSLFPICDIAFHVFISQTRRMRRGVAQPFIRHFNPRVFELSLMNHSRKSIFVGWLMRCLETERTFGFAYRKTCMLLDDAKLKNLHYEIVAAMESTSRVEARRNAGYLYAIQHGARHIFDAYPETYISAKIPLEVRNNNKSDNLNI